jgi:hypothetical protein
MPSTPFEEPPLCIQRTVVLIKGPWIGAFFLHTGARNVVHTFDPRLSPNFHFYEYTTPELAIERFNELVEISRQNGWTVAFRGVPNNARLS